MIAVKTTLPGCAAACVALLVSPAPAQHDDHGHKPGAMTAPARQTDRKSDPYLLDVCVVSGEKLGSMGEPIVKAYDGREIRFCCKGCIKKFEENPTAYVAAIDKAWKEHHGTDAAHDGHDAHDRASHDHDGHGG